MTPYPAGGSAAENPRAAATGRLGRAALGSGLAAACAAALVSASPAPAPAQVLELGDGPVVYRLGGYLRTFSGLTRPPADLALAAQIDRPTSQTVNLFRLEHDLSLGPRASAEVHNRLTWLQGPEVGAVGLGVTPQPERMLDLDYDLVETEDATLTHDFDRAVFRAHFDRADVAIGRQTITWGSAQLFTAADLWSPFSPYELDTTQKRGVDAARAILSPADLTELELLVVDRGSLRDLSGGAKLHVYGARLDGFVAAGKASEQIVAAGGARTEAGAWTLQAEGVLPARIREVDTGRDPEPGIQPPRATAGAQRFAEDWTFVVEAHYNGAGAPHPDDYAERLADPDFERGETFWFGRYYAGATIAYLPTLEWTLTGGGIANIRDPSALALASAEYELGQDFALTGGYAGGFGSDPELELVAGQPELSFPSEFGLFGHTGYVEVALFF